MILRVIWYSHRSSSAAGGGLRVKDFAPALYATIRGIDRFSDVTGKLASPSMLHGERRVPGARRP